MATDEDVRHEVQASSLEDRRILLQKECRALTLETSFSDTNESTEAAMLRLAELTDQYYQILEEMRSLGMDLPWLG